MFKASFKFSVLFVTFALTFANDDVPVLLDENILSFPSHVRLAHAVECNPLRNAWILCENFETDDQEAYVDKPNPLQRRQIGMSVQFGGSDQRLNVASFLLLNAPL